MLSRSRLSDLTYMHCLHSTSRVLMLYLGMIIHSSVGVGSIGSWIIMCMGFTNRNHFNKGVVGCRNIMTYTVKSILIQFLFCWSRIDWGVYDAQHRKMRDRSRLSDLTSMYCLHSTYTASVLYVGLIIRSSVGVGSIGIVLCMHHIPCRVLMESD